MELCFRRMTFGCSMDILLLVASLCISLASAQPPYSCPPEMYNLAVTSRALCLDESRGVTTTTTEAPPTTPADDDVDDLFEEDNEADEEEPSSPATDPTTPSPSSTEPSTRSGSRRMRNKARRMNRRRRMQVFKDCFQREMMTHPMAAEIMDSCMEQVNHRSAAVELKKEKKCFIVLLRQECPGILNMARGNRFSNYRFRF